MFLSLLQFAFLSHTTSESRRGLYRKARQHGGEQGWQGARAEKIGSLHPCASVGPCAPHSLRS